MTNTNGAVAAVEHAFFSSHIVCCQLAPLFVVLGAANGRL